MSEPNLQARELCENVVDRLERYTTKMLSNPEVKAWLHQFDKTAGKPPTEPADAGHPIRGTIATPTD